MTFTLLYDSGGAAREIAMTMLAYNVNAMNPKFHLVFQEVAWVTYSSTMLPARMIPLFGMNRQADSTDPDSLAFPFMHSLGMLS